MSVLWLVVAAVLRPWWRYKEWRSHWRVYVQYKLAEPNTAAVKSYWRGRRDSSPPWPLPR